jgi:hypothetical protein
VISVHRTIRVRADASALDLLSYSDRRDVTMTRAHWLLLGAIGVGVAIGIYLLFFCPTECH